MKARSSPRPRCRCWPGDTEAALAARVLVQEHGLYPRPRWPRWPWRRAGGCAGGECSLHQPLARGRSFAIEAGRAVPPGTALSRSRGSMAHSPTTVSGPNRRRVPGRPGTLLARVDSFHRRVVIFLVLRLKF